MLVTLLLPAVQAARAAARRTQCTNGIRNLVLGILNFESSNQVLPEGWTAKTDNQAEWAWSTYILPFIEEQGLYDALGVNERRLWDVVRDPKLRHLAQTPIPIFNCPEDESIELLRGGGNTFGPPIERHFRCSGCPGAPEFEPAKANYIGVCGMWDKFRLNQQQRRSSMPTVKWSWATSKTEPPRPWPLVSEIVAVAKVRGSVFVTHPGPDLWGSYFVRGRVSIRLNDPRDVNQFRSRSCHRRV